MSGLGSDVGETTTRGEVGLIEAYALLNSAGGTVKARAARRRVGEVGTSAGLRDLGGTDGGDVGGSGRENGVEVVLRAGRIGTSVSTRVSRGADEGDSTNTNLLEFGVDPLDVLGVVETELLALGSSNAVLALGLLVPSVRDGVDERNNLGGKHVAGESVQPDVVLLDPEPSLSSNSNSQDVLDVEGSFDLGVGGVIVTNDVVGSHWRNVDGELGGEVGEIGGGEVLVLELDDTSGGVTGNLGRSSLVDDLDGLGGNGNQSLRLGRLLEGKARNGELAKSSNEFDVLGKVVGDGKLAKLTNELSSSLLVFEESELSVEQFGGGSNRGLGVDGVSSVFQFLGSTVDQPSHDLLLDLDGRGDERSDLLNAHEVTVVRAIGIADIPEEGLKLFQVVLFESDDEREFVGLLSSTQVCPR